jgi:hypothetical protein
MLSKYLIFLIPLFACSCDIQMPWESNKIDISNGISLDWNKEKEGDVVLKEEFANIDSENSFVLFFQKMSIKGKTDGSKKSLYEYSKLNSDEVFYSEKIIKDNHKSKVTFDENRPTEESIISEIEGETFIYSKKNGKWDVKLKGKNPTKKQKEYINNEIVSKNSSCTSFKQKIKLGEKIKLDYEGSCTFGIGKFGKINSLSVSFTDTLTIDKKLYAFFLMVGEVELSIDKHNAKFEVGSIEEERNVKDLKMKADFIRKIKYCVNDDFIEKEETEVTAKGTVVREFSGMNTPMKIKTTMNTVTNNKLLSRKK